MHDQDHKQAVADQVIVSAGNILAAAGFDREEIAHFFRQAADHLAPGAGAGTETAAEGSVRPGMAPVHAAFRQSKPVADLQPLIAQARSLPPLDGEGTALKDAFDLAMQMAGHLAEAQNGLRALAKEAELPVYSSRQEWMESTGIADLSQAPPAICLEDFEPAYQGAFAAIGAVLEELVCREDAEAFTFLLGHLAENGVAIDSGLHTSIAKAARLLLG